MVAEKIAELVQSPKDTRCINLTVISLFEGTLHDIDEELVVNLSPPGSWTWAAAMEWLDML